jgi:tetraacyldisaccharide 4'-kinase
MALEFSTDRGTTPSISVGNLAFGGRGKTPLVAAIVRHLLQRGERPAILSRGYGRRTIEDGATIVSDGAHVVADLDRAGDEPLMLARALPGAIVVVSDVRAVAAAIARHHLGATVLVLDDGFQHRQLRRDVDLVAVTPEDLKDRRVPFGRLREGVSALARAHAVIVDGPADPRPPVPPSVKVFALGRTIGPPVPLEPERRLPAGRPPVVAVAGIARPDRLRRTLEGDGWTVARLLTYADHHLYRRRDLDAIARAVQETRAAGVLTTEKDAVRLLRLRPLPCPFAAVPLVVSVEPAAAFEGWLDTRLGEARA